MKFLQGGRKAAGVLIAVWLLTAPELAAACSVCYGDPGSPVSRGVTMAVLALIVITGAVIAPLVWFFYSVNRRAKALANGAEQSGAV